MINTLILQTNFLPQADATTTYITLGIIAGFAVLLVVGGYISSKKQGSSSYSGSKAGGAKAVSPAASKRKFRKLCKQMGLSSNETRLLEELASRYKIGSPLAFINSPNILNTTMKKAVADFNSGAYSAEAREDYKLMLFHAKQKIDRNGGVDKKVNSSRQLHAGSNITLTTNNGEKYSSYIVTNLKDYMCASIPMKNDGSMLRIAKWDSVKISLWEKGDRGYTFDSKVMGYSKIKGVACLMLQHSNIVQSSKKRSFPRKELNRSCYFYKINIVTIGTGKNIEKKAVVEDKKGRLGTVIEISAGGCSIKAGGSLPKGTLIKADIDIERKNTVSVLGKIVNVRRASSSFGIMHIQFTRMSKKNMNFINSYVYGIGEKTSILDY